MSSRKVTKVVIPVAGMGTRFLPVTKALPKELLPIVDKPIIHYIVREAIDAGIETVVFVTARPKILIEDYFDPKDLTSYKLSEAGKDSLIEEVLAISKKIDIVSVRQYEPRGLGHAILQASPVVSGQAFSVVLGDDIILESGLSALGQCLESFSSAFDSGAAGSVIGCIEVPRAQTGLYGIASLRNEDPKSPFCEISGFVEKPSPAKAPSTWAMPGRYVFEDDILRALKETAPGVNGEIQLTDAMQSMLSSGKRFFARKISGERYDTGDKLGYIIANIAVALKDRALEAPLREWLKNKLAL